MGLLDERTLDRSDPDFVMLRSHLAGVFRREASISDISQRARVPDELVTWQGNAMDMWTSVIEQAMATDRLRVLLDLVEASSQTDGRPELRTLIIRLRKADPQLPPAFDVYSLGLLTKRRSFIDRDPLRKILRSEFAHDGGARVLVVRPRELGTSNGVRGVSHTWHLVNVIGRRTNNYDAYRIDLTSETTPQSPRRVFEMICRQLKWPIPPVDETAQPDTAVRLLVESFKGLGRTLPRRTCLVFDGFTDVTADKDARRLAVSIASAANQDEAGDVRVVLLWVDSPLTSELTYDAAEEHITGATLDHLMAFFRNAAAARGEVIDEPAGMAVLLAKVLGSPPYSADLDLATVGPRAASVASAAFGEEQ